MHAQLAERARHGLEGRDVQDVRALGRDDRVEHERLDVGRVLGGVVERDLGAVGDAEEHELLVAGLDAQRLDVVDRVRRAVEAARRAELVGARLRGRRRSTRRRARRPGRCRRPELPVPRWSKTSRSRVASAGAEDRRELGRERAAPPGPGRRPAPTTARRGRVARGDDALDAQRHRARDGAGAVERDRELAALEAGGLARRVGDGRVRRPGRRRAPRRPAARAARVDRARMVGQGSGRARSGAGARARVTSVRRACPTIAIPSPRPARPTPSGPTATRSAAAACSSARARSPLDPATGKLVEGSIGEQTRRCLENLQAGLRSGRRRAGRRGAHGHLRHRHGHLPRGQRGLRQLLRRRARRRAARSASPRCRWAPRSRSTRSSRCRA